MASQADAVNWLNSMVGQYKNFDGLYGNQCVDLFNFYYQYLVGRSPYSDGYGVPGAKDLWNIPTNYFDKIPDSATLKPQPGDIAIYGSKWGGGYGHVEMVLSTDANGCWFVGNNETGDPSKPAMKVYRTWAKMAGLIGVMRFKNFQTNTTGGNGVADTITQDTSRIIAHGVLGRNGKAGRPNALNGGSDQWAGQPLTNAYVQSLFLSVESRQWRDSGDVNSINEMQRRWELYPQLEAQLKEVQTALANEQAKPPKEVVKEVQVIVDRPVEVVKEVPVYTVDTETRDNVAKILNMVTSVYNYFVGQFKTFSKYIKKG